MQLEQELQQYKQLLQSQDWYYSYSDDYSVWKRGQDQYTLLDRMNKKLDTSNAIWNQYAPKNCKRKVKVKYEAEA